MSKSGIFSSKMSKRLSIIDNDVGDFINSCMTNDLFKDIVFKNFQDLKNYDVLYALLYTLHPSLSTYAWKWFLGAKLSKE